MSAARVPGSAARPDRTVRIVRGGDGDERDEIVAAVVGRALAMLGDDVREPEAAAAWWRAGLIAVAGGRRPRSTSELAASWTGLTARR